MHIIKLFLSESLMIALLGGILGTLFGIGIGCLVCLGGAVLPVLQLAATEPLLAIKNK